MPSTFNELGLRRNTCATLLLYALYTFCRCFTRQILPAIQYTAEIMWSTCYHNKSTFREWCLVRYWHNEKMDLEIQVCGSTDKGLGMLVGTTWILSNIMQYNDSTMFTDTRNEINPRLDIPLESNDPQCHPCHRFATVAFPSDRRVAVIFFL